MTENEIIKIVDDELAKSEACIKTMTTSKSWPDQGTFAKKAVIAQQNALVALTTLIKRAISAS